MHGRPRKSATPVDKTASALKAAKIRSLQTQFLQNHDNNIYTKDALALNAMLLETNPEFMTAWNYRKLAFEHNISSQSEDSDHIKSIIDEELRVVENALRKNFKSYGAWHHRKWVVSKGKGNSSTERELKLLNMFQKQDTRNFHAWNYRRFIAGLKNISDQNELQVTTDMINDNFSNYSAWHNRSVLLSHLLEKKVIQKEIFLREEYEFVRNAVFTDPDDQSGWFYHLWLLDQTVKVDNMMVPSMSSSWPPSGSDIKLPISNNKVTTFPVVLYFNEHVKGITSNTLVVQINDHVLKDITWSPLSTNKLFTSAQAWLTHINIPHEEDLNSSKTYQVKIIRPEEEEDSRRITSLGGVPWTRIWSFSFRVSVCRDTPTEGFERIMFKDENFCTIDTSLTKMPLFELTKSEDEQPPPTWKLEMLDCEIAQYREFLTWADCKIGKLTLARLLMAHDDAMTHVDEVLQLYSELMKLDSPHYQYYKDEHSLVLLKQATCSMESLLKYCWQYKESGCICLRLNSLSLSRIGCFERLLWVQSLDLSHNQIHSIEGLEALQLLTCLNISHNKITNFTALDPLRFLKSSLKVLDVSHNEIGSHTVDTRRYLCASPMSHTLCYDPKFEEIGGEFWEAYSVFGGLEELMQLDIVGNDVVDDKRFVSFLVTLLPRLKWLDGQQLH